MRDINESIEKNNRKVKEALQPISIERTNITITSLKKLKNNEEIQIQHPLIKDMILKIRKEFSIQNVLNIPTVFYGTKYIISDTFEKVFPEHEVLLNEEEMIDYVELLLIAKNSCYYHYYRSLARNGLKPGNIIEFDNGSQGMIVVPEGDTFPRNPVFVLLKKDGTPSKLKPRYIYANMKYEKIREVL